MIEDGTRSHKFAIRRATLTRIGQDRKPVWNTIGHRFGSLIPGSVTEPVVTDQAKPQTAWKIEILYFPGLTSRDRLELGNRIFKIVGPPLDPDQDRFHHVVNVVELEFPDPEDDG